MSATRSAGDEASVEVESSIGISCGDKLICPSSRTPLMKNYNPLMSLELIQALDVAAHFCHSPSCLNLTTERSFSALNCIKRSTTNKNRLNGLAHLYINVDIELVFADVIDEFSKTHCRLNFQ